MIDASCRSEFRNTAISSGVQDTGNADLFTAQIRKLYITVCLSASVILLPVRIAEGSLAFGSPSGSEAGQKDLCRFRIQEASWKETYTKNRVHSFCFGEWALFLFLCVFRISESYGSCSKQVLNSVSSVSVPHILSYSSRTSPGETQSCPGSCSGRLSLA